MEQLKISENLKEAGFIAIRPNSKLPLAPEGYDWNNLILDYDRANLELQQGNNIALVGGYNGFIPVDCDSIELYEAFNQLMYKTYFEKSISGTYHLIYKADNWTSTNDDNVSIDWNNKHMGEIRAYRMYMLIAPSKAKDPRKGIMDVRPYEIIEDNPVCLISREDILKITQHFGKTDKEGVGLRKKINGLTQEVKSQIESDPDLKKLFDGDVSEFGGDRSNAEQSLVQKLIARGFDKETIFAVMSQSKTDKWNEKPLSYREMTYNKGVALTTQQKQGWQDGKNLSIPIKRQLFKTFGELKRIKKSNKFIIEDLMYPEEITMKTGQTGSFKSMEMAYRALCIATGKPYLGRFKVKKQRVAIISAEQSAIIDKERLIKMAKGLKIRTPKNLFIQTRDVSCDILNKAYQEELGKFLEENKINVLFIDSINPVTPDIDDNSARDVTKVFNNFLKPFVEKYKIHVEFLQHTDKRGKSYLGSIKWKGNVDNEFFVERKGLTNEFILSNEKNRRGEVLSLKIAIDFREDQILFNLVEQKGLGRTEKKNYSKKQIAVFGIKEQLKNGSFKFDDLKVLVMQSKKISEGTFKTACKEMLLQGSIIKNEDGGYMLQ